LTVGRSHRLPPSTKRVQFRCRPRERAPNAHGGDWRTLSDRRP
jgi:hypothetical protein